MCSVWRFFYKREVISKYNILFPKGVKLIEDKIFNCHFFLYAKKIFIHNQKCYYYEIKSNGLMTSSLQNPQSLLKDKLDGISERRRLQELSKYKQNRLVSHVCWFLIFIGIRISCKEFWYNKRGKNFPYICKAKRCTKSYLNNTSTRKSKNKVASLSLKI